MNSQTASNNESLKKYALEIQQPDDHGYSAVCLMESDEPFLSINKGDFLNPLTWNLYCYDSLETEDNEPKFGTVLKVLGIEHSFVQRENGEVKQHKLVIFAEPVENNQLLLYSKS